jgi:uncharacterized surface protein with fasciclin (FAS1) repeats
LEDNSAADGLKTLAGLLDETRLTNGYTLSEMLDDPKMCFTLFAPTDSAFRSSGERLRQAGIELDKLPPHKVKDILLYHIMLGRVTSGNMRDGATPRTMTDKNLLIWFQEGGTVAVNGSRITHGDIEATNGVIHLIDRALCPLIECDPRMSPPIEAERVESLLDYDTQQWHDVFEDESSSDQDDEEEDSALVM